MTEALGWPRLSSVHLSAPAPEGDSLDRVSIASYAAQLPSGHLSWEDIEVLLHFGWHGPRSVFDQLLAHHAPFSSSRSSLGYDGEDTSNHRLTVHLPGLDGFLGRVRAWHAGIAQADKSTSTASAAADTHSNSSAGRLSSSTSDGLRHLPPSLPEGWKHITRIPSTNLLIPSEPSYHQQAGDQPTHRGSVPKQVEPSPPVGTWANRQYHPFNGAVNNHHQHQPQPPFVVDPSGTAKPITLTALQQARSSNQSSAQSVSTPSAAIPISRSPFAGSTRSFPTHIPIPASQAGAATGAADANGHNGAAPAPAYDGDKAEAAAWRWRFTRRWQAEQSRAPDEAQCSVGADTIMEDALEYLHACGGSARTNNHLQIARVSSELGISYCGSLTALGSGPLTNQTMLNAGEVMLGTDGGSESLRGDSPDANDNMAATREVAVLNKRAQAVLRQQQDIEAKAQQRWQQATVPGQQWVGNYLDTVEIEESGSFAFLLLKVKDKCGRMKIIVRGRIPPHKCTLMECITRQVQKVASLNGVSPEPLQLMGGGVMEWRTDRDRHLHLHSGFVSDPSAFNRSIGVAPIDLLNLTSVLTSQQLPLHYKVTIEGQQI